MAGIVIAEKLEKNKFKSELDGEEYKLRKRLPSRWPKTEIDVYVTQKTNFKAQMSRCSKLLSKMDEIYVHGLGLAVDRAVNIALQLRAMGCGTIEVSAKTNTVELTDDLVAANDELEDKTRRRNTNAVHIRVFKVDMIKRFKKAAVVA